MISDMAGPRWVGLIEGRECGLRDSLHPLEIYNTAEGSSGQVVAGD